MSETAAGVPAWIATPVGRCFTWYHAPAAKARECAVLLCDPFGWNRMVLHIAYRQLALRLANAGFAVMRIDYPGTCDSEGYPRDRARVEGWLRCLDSAADYLRKWSRARELAACGAMLGGTLAALLAARRSDVAGLALWGPFAQGRAMVRSEIAATATRGAGVDRRPPGFRDGDLEALGFLLSAEMAGDLRAIDLLSERFTEVRHALVLQRSRVPAMEKRLAEHLAAQGTAVDYRTSPADDLEGVLQQAGAGHPAATIEEIVRWLGERFAQPRAGAPGMEGPAASDAAVELIEQGARIRESAVRFGPGSAIFGILSEPLLVSAEALAVLLVNGGHNHRSGVNRNYTEWARRFAASGYRVLRMDLRGLGDSPPPDPAHLGRLYTEHGTRDVLEAVRWLRERGAGQVCCVGLCAGGYQALHAALREAPIEAIVLLNPLRFHADGANVRPVGLARVLRRLKSRLPRPLRAWAAEERRVARSFAVLAKRGVEVLVVYNANERYREFLEGALHPLRHALQAGGRFRLEIVGPSDHIFSPLWAQAEVAEALERFIGGLAGRLAARRHGVVSVHPR